MLHEICGVNLMWFSYFLKRIKYFLASWWLKIRLRVIIGIKVTLRNKRLKTHAPNTFQNRVCLSKRFEYFKNIFGGDFNVRKVDHLRIFKGTVIPESLLFKEYDGFSGILGLETRHFFVTNTRNMNLLEIFIKEPLIKVT